MARGRYRRYFGDAFCDRCGVGFARRAIRQRFCSERCRLAVEAVSISAVERIIGKAMRDIRALAVPSADQPALSEAEE